MITSSFGIFHLLYSYVLFFRLIIDGIFALLILLEMSIFILETADIWISLYLLFFHEMHVCMYRFKISFMLGFLLNMFFINK